MEKFPSTSFPDRRNANEQPRHAIRLAEALSYIRDNQKHLLQSPISFEIQTPVDPSDLRLLASIDHMEVVLMRSERAQSVILTTGSKYTTEPNPRGYNDRGTHRMQISEADVHIHSHPSSKSIPSQADIKSRGMPDREPSYIFGNDGVTVYVGDALGFAHSLRALLNMYGRKTLVKEGIQKAFAPWDSPEAEPLLQEIARRLNGES